MQVILETNIIIIIYISTATRNPSHDDDFTVDAVQTQNKKKVLAPKSLQSKINNREIWIGRGSNDYQSAYVRQCLKHISNLTAVEISIDT